jgi:peroxiredoxin
VEFLRALNVLGRHHPGDPELARLGLDFHNYPTRQRDAYFEQVHQRAKGHEAEGLIRLGYADYLAQKALHARGVRLRRGQTGYTNHFTDQTGQPASTFTRYSDDEMAYFSHLQLCDPEAIRAKAESLYQEVIENYADVTYITSRLRAIQAVLREPEPVYEGRKLSASDRARLEKRLASTETLGAYARRRLEALTHLQVGQPAPEIEGPGLDGEVMKLADFRDKVVLLDFWFAGCGPCIEEVPNLRKLIEAHQGQPLVVLGVNVDEVRDEAIKAVGDTGIAWPSWADPEKAIARRYNVEGYPTIMAIDAQGRIRALNLRGPMFEPLITKLLEEAEAGAEEQKPGI